MIRSEQVDRSEDRIGWKPFGGFRSVPPVWPKTGCFHKTSEEQAHTTHHVVLRIFRNSFDSRALSSSAQNNLPFRRLFEAYTVMIMHIIDELLQAISTHVASDAAAGVSSSSDCIYIVRSMSQR